MPNVILPRFKLLVTFMGNLLKGNYLMRAKLAVIVATILLLVGCSSISSGYITAKKYHEAYDYPVSYCAMYDSKMNCKLWAQRWEHVREKWSFDIRNDNRDTGFVYVSESEYNEYQIGDYYGEKR